MKLVKKINESINNNDLRFEVSKKIKLQKHNYILENDEEDLFVTNQSSAFQYLKALKDINYIDYQLYRTNLKEVWGLLPDNLWNVLDFDIRYEVAINKSCSQERILNTIPNDRERWRARTDFAQFAIRSRRDRYEYIKSILIDNVVADPVLMQVMDDMKQYNIETLYVNDGLEGTLFGDVNGVYLGYSPEDYIENALNYIDATTQQWHINNIGLGTDPIFGIPYGRFSSVGLRSKNFTMFPNVNYSKNQMCDEMLEYLKYGYNKTLIIEM